MTLDEFVSAWTGKKVDTDGTYPNQCMDLLHQYLLDVYNLPLSYLAAPSAYLVYTSFDKLVGHENFSLTANTPLNVPLKGDIVVFDKTVGKDGHVCTFVEGDTNDFTSFDANWPVGFLPHLVKHTYGGVLGWLHYIGIPMSTTKYKIGDIVRPTNMIAVGQSPGSESVTYGTVSADHPAKIVGFMMVNNEAYYNIDQTDIGGGTGWVKAKDLDNASPYIEPAKQNVIYATPSASPPPTVYSEDQYLAVVKDRDQAMQQYTQTHDQLVQAQSTLGSFKALGIEKVDDISKLKQQYDTTIQGINTQLLQVLERNKKLASIVQEKEDEDFTAIEEGMKAAEEATELKDHIQQIAKNVGTRPDIGQILQKIWSIMSLAERAVKQAKSEAKRASQVSPVTPQEIETSKKQTIYGITWLMNFFGLSKGGVQ